MSFIKWPGGKASSLKQLLPYFPKKFNSYFEPFIGGGAVFFAVQPNKSEICDINTKLIKTYRVVRDSAKELAELLDEKNQLTGPAAFYDEREKFNSQQSDLELAARFIYLNKNCFNGLYRENSKGKFNSPYGKRVVQRLYDPVQLQKDSWALRNTDIYCTSFANINPSEGDFVYLDPPYIPLNKISFTQYHKSGFGLSEQELLRQKFQEWSEAGVRVALSNSDAETTRELYDGYRMISTRAPRSINRDSSGRGRVGELLILSWDEENEQ
jgi:DNA adenine methylase